MADKGKLQFLPIRYDPKGSKYAFLQVPMMLLKDKMFKDLSSDAILLYSLMLDRLSLSWKNGWIDEENKVYIIYKVDEAMENLKRSKGTIINARTTLEKIGLIEIKRRGLGEAAIIYVNDFSTGYYENSDDNVDEKPNEDTDNSSGDKQNDKDISSSENNKSEPANAEKSTEVQNLDHRGSKIEPPRSNKRTTEVQETDQINNNIIQTESIQTCLTDVLRAREDDEDKLNGLVEYIESRIGRNLDIQERSICHTLLKNQTNPKFIAISLNDNLFRGSRFKVDHIFKQIKDWKRYGVKYAYEAWNDILYARTENLRTLAIQKADDKNPYMTDDERQKFVDRIMEKNEVAQINSVIDRAKEYYEQEDMSKMLQTVEIAMEQGGVSVVQYLAPEMQQYVMDNTCLFDAPEYHDWLDIEEAACWE